MDRSSWNSPFFYWAGYYKSGSPWAEYGPESLVYARSSTYIFVFCWLVILLRKAREVACAASQWVLSNPFVKWEHCFYHAAARPFKSSSIDIRKDEIMNSIYIFLCLRKVIPPKESNRGVSEGRSINWYLRIRLCCSNFGICDQEESFLWNVIYA